MLDTPSDDGPPDAPSAGPSALREALRRARAEAAERTDVVIDLRAAEIARLEILKDALDPVFDEVPDEVDVFDVAIAQGERPRLFVDMVAFVEMGRDRRTYRFQQDGRRGRALVAESAETGPIVEAVTAYVARRLVERERLLVDDIATSAPERKPPAQEPAAAPASVDAAPAAVAAPAGRPMVRLVAILFAFGFGAGLGALAVAALILASARGMLPI